MRETEPAGHEPTEPAAATADHPVSTRRQAITRLAVLASTAPMAALLFAPGSAAAS